LPGPVPWVLVQWSSGRVVVGFAEDGLLEAGADAVEAEGH
jgi:hypothetical protein